MKKFSKILVILLTLAMLLGVVVISASADTSSAAIVLTKSDGTVVTTYTKLSQAFQAANEDTGAGDVTIAINKDISIDAVVTVTRDADKYGKVILDLNGHKLTLTQSSAYTTVMSYIASGGMAKDAAIYVKANADAAAVAYFLDTALTEFSLTKLDGTAVTAKADLVAGETYIGTVTGTKVATNTHYRGNINVSGNAYLMVEGDGAFIDFGGNSHVFYIDDGNPNAELYVRDVEIYNNSSTYLCQTNSGTATFDSIVATREKSVAPLFRHASDSQLNIKNSVFTQVTGNGANFGIVFTEGTNLSKAADGYHIEIDNCNVTTATALIVSATTSASSCSTYNDQYISSTKTKTYFGDNVRHLGTAYKNTSVRVENSKVEVICTGRARNDSNCLVGVGTAADVDFNNCNLLIAQLGIRAVAASGTTAVINFNGCYIELTGKGNLVLGQAPTILFSVGSTTANFKNTEFRIGELVKNAGTVPGGTTALNATKYWQSDSAVKQATFYPGCVFDAACAPDTATLKGRISGDYITNDKGELAVIGFDAPDGVLLNHYNHDSITSIGIASTGKIDPITILSGGRNTATKYGATGGNVGFSYDFTQGRMKLATEANGNKYVAYDPSVVFSDAVSGTYAEAAGGAISGLAVPDIGVTVNGGWVKDSAIIYLNTDDNASDAEYALVNGTWTKIPEKYSQIYVGTSQYLYIQNANLNATEYEYLTFTFNYMNAPDSDYFIPVILGVQGRTAYGGNTTNSLMKIGIDGTLYVHNGTEYKNEAKLAKDEWSEITVVVKVIEEDVGEGNGYKISVTKDSKGNEISCVRSNLTYKNSLVSVYFNGSKVGQTIKLGLNDYNIIAGLRGRIDNGAACNTAIAGGALLCMDDITRGRYFKGYDTTEVDAVVASGADIAEWSDFYANLDYYGSFPAAKENVAKIEYGITLLESAKWTTYSYINSSNNKETVARYSTELGKTVIYFDDASDAAAHGANMTVDLLADAEKVEVNVPTTFNTVKGEGENYEFTYFSNAYKGVETDGIVVFTKASEADLVEVTYDYADGEDAVTETFIKGGYFWLDAERIPTKLADFDVANGRDIKLAFNGNLLDAFNSADFAKGFLVNEDSSFVFSYETTKQYGWVITTLGGDFIYDADRGDTYTDLVNRVNAIETLFDPFANDAEGTGADLVLDSKGNATGLVSSYKHIIHATEGYTIKLFKNFNNVGTLKMYPHVAGKTVNYDLNGHTVSYSSTAYTVFGAEVAWEYDKTTGKVVQVHGTPNDNTFSNQGAKTLKSDSNGVYVVLGANKNAVLNIYSSVPGAKMYTEAKANFVGHAAQERIDYKNSAGTSTRIVSSYETPTVCVGTPVAASHTGSGPDANALTLESKNIAAYYTSQFGSTTYLRNLNLISGTNDGVIAPQNGNNYIDNCNIISTATAGKGVINAYTGTQLAEFKKCNIVSEKVQNLFNHAGHRGQDSTNYIGFYDSYLYNTKLTGTKTAYGQQTGSSPADRSAFLTAGCYYNIFFTEESMTMTSGKAPGVVAKLVTLRSSVVSSDYYEGNVYANKTIKINGKDYTFTYKVVDSADIVNVTWKNADGTKTLGADKYVNGAQLVYDKGIGKYDDITLTKYTFEALGVATPDLVINASSDTLIPAFSVKTNLNLETNLKHNIKIFRYVTDANGNLVDAYANVTSVSIGGVVYELELNLGEDETEGTADDYYYYTVDVKSNAIADTYDLVINFKTLDGKDVSVTKALSVAGYLEQGLAAEKADTALYNLFASIVKYGIASYANFDETAVGDVAVLEALAAKYPVALPVIDEVAAGAAGANLDVEFVLDDELEYRLYLVGFGEQVDMTNVFIKYTALDGSVREISFAKKNLKLESDDGKYWVDFSMSAFDFGADLTITVINTSAGVNASVEYSIENYYADAKAAGSSAELLALVEALNAYAVYANAYMAAK